MSYLARVTDKATCTAEARRVTFLAIDTLGFVVITHLLQNIKYIKETTDEEGSLKTRDSIVGQRGSLAAMRAFYCLSLCSLLH